MPISSSQLTELLTTQFPEANITLNDLAGDNDHWEVTISDASLEGKTRITQHRLVQAAVKDHDIHALSIKVVPAT